MTKIFSERQGYVDPGCALQIESASYELRIDLYNIIYTLLEEYAPQNISLNIRQDIWGMIWHLPIDTFPIHTYEFYDELRSRILDGEWFLSYDYFEYIHSELNRKGVFSPGLREMLIPRNPNEHTPNEIIHQYINQVLEKNCSGYRFIDGMFVPITNEAEVQTIEKSLSLSNGEGVRSHIQQALALMAKKPQPDLRNTVSESILAVESAAKCVSSCKTKTLADALKNLGDSKGLHKSLVGGWKQIYGFTSDVGGIRHAGSGEPIEISYSFARYMLVTCSAFANYLLEEFGESRN